jgi:hypothetical protein
MRTPNLFRYYMNVCTVSYSGAWWDWSRWQREIDWMALHGINLPLTFTGQEIVWRQLWLEVGLTDAEIQRWLAGPAFLAWQRMGNIRGWAGPLSANWIKQQAVLGVQIAQRQAELGMINVLPGFRRPRARGAAPRLSRPPTSRSRPTGGARRRSTAATICSSRSIRSSPSSARASIT